MVNPHKDLGYITPDEFAETRDGVCRNGMGLYQRLWALTAFYTKIDREDCGPADVVGVNSIASFWDKLSEEDQLELNDLAKGNRARYALVYTSDGRVA